MDNIIRSHSEEIYDLCYKYMIPYHGNGSSYFGQMHFHLNMGITGDIKGFKVEVIAEEVIVSGELFINTNSCYVNDKNERISKPIERELLLPFSFTVKTENKEINNMQFGELNESFFI